MPSRQTKKQNVDVKYQLTRSPLGYPKIYPAANAEKENMDFSSSEDSPEKSRSRSSSYSPRKNNSPSDTDYTQDLAKISKHKSGKHRQQNLMNKLQGSDNLNISPNREYRENSDMEMEIDDFIDNNYPLNQRQVTPEKVSPSIKNRKYIPSKSKKSEDSTKPEARRFDQPQIQPERLYPSIDAPKSSNFFTSLYPFIYCVILIILSLAYLVPRYMGSSSANDQLNATTLVLNLKSEFVDQPALTFRIIHSALKKVLEPQPESPAIILLLATNGSQAVCRDFALKMIDSLSIPEYSVKISGEKYKLANANKAKMDIAKTIDRALKNNQLGSVLIEDLDQIPGQSATILYKYSDHENALFKKAVFVMTVNYNMPIINLSDTKEWDKAANDHLHSVWTDTGVDQITPLLARLTVSVAVINTKT